MATLKYLIDATGVKRGASSITRALASIGNSARRAGSSITNTLVNPLTASLASIAAGATAIKLTQIGDQYTNMAGQLDYLTGSTENAEIAQEQLYKMSQKTSTSMTDNAKAFTRFAIASEMTGLTTEQNITALGNINVLLAKTGVSSSEASAGMIQLGQALSSGKLQGDEYRSLSENMPALMAVIADSLDVPIGKLKTMSSEGKLTSEILAKSFLEMGTDAKNGNETITKSFGVTLVRIGKVKEKAKELPLTVTRSWTQIINVSQRLWDKINDKTGILGLIANGISNLASWVEEKTPVIVTFFDEMKYKAIEAWPEIKLFLANLWYEGSKVVTWFIESSGYIPAFVDRMEKSFNDSMPTIKAFMKLLGNLLELIGRTTAAAGAVAGDLMGNVEQHLDDTGKESVSLVGAVWENAGSMWNSAKEAWSDPLLTSPNPTAPKSDRVNDSIQPIAKPTPRATPTEKASSTININVTQPVSRSDISNIARGMELNATR